MDIFIFTKDRACQLHLLLESIQTNMPGVFSPKILYKCSSDEYRAGYELLKTRFDAEWTEETITYLDFVYTIDSCDKTITLCTDDTVFYRKFVGKESDILHLLEDQSIHCFSWRLGCNTTVQNYATGQNQPPLYPTKLVDNKYAVWDWRKYPFTSNYGYVFGMDAVTYRSENLLHHTQDTKNIFDGFRSWESYLSNQPYRSNLTRHNMACAIDSYAVNIPTNSCQYPPIANQAVYQLSLDDLNTAYLNGKKLSLQQVMSQKIVGAHQDIPMEIIDVN